jgi:hypothetical protein
MPVKDKPPLHPTDDLMHGVSPIQERLIGRLIVQWGYVEAGLNDVIWRLLKLHVEDGRALTTRMDAVTKIAILRKIAPRYLEGEALTEFLKVMKLADDVRDDRNFIAHGNWGTAPSDGVALALSLRGKADPGEVKTLRSRSVASALARAITAGSRRTVLKPSRAWPLSPHLAQW